MSKRTKATTDMRQVVAEALIVWIGGFEAGLKPNDLVWSKYSPWEQMRALKAAEAVIGVLEKGK